MTDLPPGSSPTGVTAERFTVYQFPALEGQGIGMLIVNMEPCSINLSHGRPRATEVSTSLYYHDTLTSQMLSSFGAIAAPNFRDMKLDRSLAGLLQRRLACWRFRIFESVSFEEACFVFTGDTSTSMQ